MRVAVFGGGGRLGEMRRETDRMNDCADGDCSERADTPSADADPLRSAVPRR